MDSLIIVLVVLLVITNLGIIFFLTRNKQEKQINQNRPLKMNLIHLKKPLVNPLVL